MKTKILGWCLDALVLAGASCFAYGLWLAWRPLGFIVAGVLVAAGAFFANYGVMRKARQG